MIEQKFLRVEERPHDVFVSLALRGDFFVTASFHSFFDV
jgi:hypothetical protein